MLKKISIILVLLLLTSGFAFASEWDSGSFPKHTITFDPIMTIGSLFVGAVLTDTNLKGQFFMTALQYEFQFAENLSAAARFGYKRIGLNETVLSSIAAESHLRVYPKDVFFLDGMLGYTNFQMTNLPNSNLFVFGLKIGCRYDYGKLGGFIFEPSFGYSYAMGKLNMGSNITGTKDKNGNYENNRIPDSVFNFLVKQYFVSGVTFNLMMGYRF